MIAFTPGSPSLLALLFLDLELTRAHRGTYKAKGSLLAVDHHLGRALLQGLATIDDERGKSRGKYPRLRVQGQGLIQHT